MHGALPSVRITIPRNHDKLNKETLVFSQLTSKSDTKFCTGIVYSINNAYPDLVTFELPVRAIFSQAALFPVYVSPGITVTVGKPQFNCRYTFM
jgi:hypothetical protein